jgi:colicin import membrane protein
MNTPIAADIRNRILTAAEALYTERGYETFPTVDQVRRAARVDMNAASVVMREWRRQKTVAAAPTAISIPDALQQASAQGLAVIWQQAQALANEALDAAKASWEQEREESEALRRELVDAYDAQGKELEAAEQSIAALQAQFEDAGKQAAATLAQNQNALEAALRRAEQDEVRIEEAARQARTLTEERDRANEASIQAREAAARLSGQLEALQGQHTALLSRLGPSPKP